MAESPQVRVPASAPPAAGTEEPLADQVLVEQDLLVEEVSIDGMCGVY
ncbi:mycofactocin precursor MftA [Streptomyces sp. NBC_01235]|nr:mycofactocin precursor MftA [Streptomyces sp. NBC_01235]WSP86147.1 mycofactocin precursor MftA [Streptomyces sp. NBC_01235]